MSEVKKTRSEEIRQHWTVPVADIVSDTDRNKAESAKDIDFASLRAVVDRNSSKLGDTMGIMELLPDLTIVSRILVSNILSPVDLQATKLQIIADSNIPPSIPEIVRKHFTTTFNLESDLDKILEMALFSVGSFSLLVMPPTMITKMISQYTLKDKIGLEQFSFHSDLVNQLPNIGVLKNFSGVDFGLEKYYEEGVVALTKEFKEITDNFNISAPAGGVSPLSDFSDSFKQTFVLTDNIGLLSLSVLEESVNTAKLNKLVESEFGFESLSKKESKKFEIVDHKVVNQPILSFDALKDIEDGKDNVLNPIVFPIPHEAVVPIHKANDPTKHTHYYIFLDEENQPIRTIRGSSKFDELSSKLNNTADQQTINSRPTTSLSYPGVVRNEKRIDTIFKPAIRNAYRKEFNEKLKAAIDVGGRNGSIEIDCPDEFYENMFYRQLKKMKTTILCVPASMLTYIAFDYSDLGFGLSLMEKTRLYASFRAVLMFATVISSLKSSINRSTLTIKLDEHDPDPQKRVEQILNEFTALQASGLPLGRLNPLDIVDSLQRAGLQIKIEGDRYPNVGMDYEETKRQITPPATDILDMFKDLHWSGLWVNRELVENSTNMELAATVNASNTLQRKLYMSAQDIYSNHLSNFIRMYIKANGPLTTELRNAYKSEKVNLSFEEMIDTIKVHFPKSDGGIIKSQSAEYELFNEFVNNAFNDTFSQDILKSLGDELDVDSVKGILLGFLKNKFMASRNMLPDLLALFNSDNTEVLSQVKDHYKQTAEILATVNKDILNINKPLVDKIKELKQELNPELSAEDNNLEDDTKQGEVSEPDSDINVDDTEPELDPDVDVDDKATSTDSNSNNDMPTDGQENKSKNKEDNKKQSSEVDNLEENIGVLSLNDDLSVVELDKENILSFDDDKIKFNFL